MEFKKYYFFLLVTLYFSFANGQEGIPIYSDYLTDNYYLLHPSTAGISINGKARLTARQQWFGVDDAPSLQTLSVNSRIGDTASGVGGIVYNDSNGFHSQSGGYLTYAHHVLLSRNPVDLNMISFGLSAGFIQYRLDETSFLSQGFDRLITGTQVSATNFNIDLGFSYHFLDFYTHFTVKNVLENDGVNFNEQGFSFNNLRTYIASPGYVFSSINSDWSYEPSVLFAYRDATKESFADFNFKVYKETYYGKIWAGISYRRSFDGAEFLNGSGVSSQKLQFFTPLLGVNYKKFVFAYTYSYQANSVVFTNGGFHQITLGINFGNTREKWDCNCPSVN
ncbi:type IX secretion system membrane protein PorP/SprF [Flavobacteriaceae bacterium AU392]|nr:type IX secretion system membrane protein PorP/SprF [Flavobacteriaceae bacterium]RKM81621.1 type IX secretion system membrane protein PorP/SprF [Flavobacteriaceae bacterium AU392]